MKEMTEIIPSINVDNFVELEQKIRLVEPYVRRAHIDVSDGVFTKHISWHDPKELVGFTTSLQLEIHLMIDRPEKEIDQWVIDPAQCIIFHQEATASHQLIIDKIHHANKESGIAIKPDTPWLKLFPYLDTVDMLQLLAVNPGPSGQEFREDVFHKLEHIHSLRPQAIIEIDGGVNIGVARRCARAGASRLVAGSAIFGSDMDAQKIEKNIKKLQNAVHDDHNKFFHALLAR